MASYANNDVLVSTDWVKQNLNTPGVKLMEIDVDTKAYDVGHIPGAVGVSWDTQLNDRVRRDILSKQAFEELMGRCGVSNSDTLVLYGDNNNWFAAFGFWIAKIYGHKDVRLMNGGRAKWLKEDDKPLTPDRPNPAPTKYAAAEPDMSLRARVADVLQISAQRSASLVDVRSPDEFSGKVIAPPGMTETAQRGGHIPGAVSVPWATACNPDGTFKSPDELKDIYFGKAGVDPAKPAVAYCRIGERSSHTWFVLKYLLGVKDVRNYDGSWTEYGNLIGAPIEKNV